MKIDIIIVYVQRYERGHEVHFVPPITGIHLAAITPPRHEVRVIHQQVQAIDFETDADLIALSFFSGFAPEAYRLASIFRQRGRRVVAGGPHATFSADETLRFVDCVVIGEAESVWEQVLADAEQGTLQERYYGESIPLTDVPTPRYDLLPESFFVTRVIQATRGCPFTCSFCTVPTLNPGFRTRPVKDVISDIRYDKFKHWWQRKIVWFWDDNLTIKRNYIRELLSAMIPEKKWWLTQASMDIAKDPALLDLMKQSGCIGVFFGIESFGIESLKDAHKQQNKVHQYRERIRELHKRGICVMAGFISGFDGDTPQSIRLMAKQLYDVGVDVPFLSILTPYRGTAAYQKMVDEKRMRLDKGWEYYNGYNVSFIPMQMSPDELLLAHRDLWKEAFSLRFSIKRVIRAFFTLRWGAFLMCAFMNGFYCLKALRRNAPKCFETDDRYSEIAKSVRDSMHVPERTKARVSVDNTGSALWKRFHRDHS
jgi:radical SAM superfamily enzyme YgiQ (UPF0313 family)